MTHETLQSATLNHEGGAVESLAIEAPVLRGDASGLMNRRAEDFAAIVQLKRNSYGDPVVAREYARLTEDMIAASYAGELEIGDIYDKRTIETQVKDFINDKIAQTEGETEQTLRQMIRNQADTIEGLQEKLEGDSETSPSPKKVDPLVPFHDRISLRQRLVALGATEEEIATYDRLADFDTAIEREAYLEGEHTNPRFMRIVSSLSVTAFTHITDRALALFKTAPHSAEIPTVAERR